MIIDLTYRCSMGCSHCMSDCQPNGMHMALETFRDALKFLDKHQILGIMLSGGEIFEHPKILEILDIVSEHERKLINSGKIRPPVILITNGRILSSNPEMQEKVKEIRKSLGKQNLLIQVTDDPRFYPKKLTEKQKYTLRKLGAIIGNVPSHDAADPKKCLYPQGRALQNYDSSYWNTKAPKCTNIRSIANQKTDFSFHEVVSTLMYHGKMCTPVIAPDGSIKLGESALCPSVASIYDYGWEIMDSIRSCRCANCKIPIEIMLEKYPSIGYLFGV